MQMEFFRRPVFAGNNLRRVPQGVVRGSVRRSDPDGVSAVPYFPNLTVGQVLTITTEFGNFTVTFTSKSFAQVLADINAQLTTHGTAFDTDGSVSIRTNTAGGAGFIEVTGGNGAPALGLWPAGRSLRSTGGDLPSAPEGRVGNPFGTAIPNKNDDMKSFQIAAAMGLLAGNLDVLYADAAREEAVLQKVGTIVASLDGKYLTPSASLRLFNGFSILSRTSLWEEIAPYFVLVDPTTKRRLYNRVVAMVYGTPVGDPPYADAATSGEAAKNAFGLNLVKFGSAAIAGIVEGRVVQAPNVGVSAKVGDVAAITSATNTDSWSNNGMKWIVEAVVDNDHVALRPMSRAELSLFSVSLNDTQPVVELSGQIAGGQSFGNLTLYTGTWSAGVSLVVTPALSASQNVELWATQPYNGRVATTGFRQRATLPLVTPALPFMSDGDALVPFSARRYSAGATADTLQLLDETNAVLTAFTASGSLYHAGTDYTINVTTAHGLVLKTNNATRWTLDSSGNWTAAVAAGQSITKTGGSLTIGTGDAQSLILKTNAVTRWTLNSSGDWINAEAQASLIKKSGGNLQLWVTDANNLVLTVGLNSWYVDTSGNLLNTDGYTPPNNRTITKTGGSLTVGTGDSHNLVLKTNAIDRWTLDTSGNWNNAEAATRSITKTGGTFVLGTTDAQSLTLRTNGVDAWTVDSSGNLIGVLAAAQSILHGGSSSFKFGTSNAQAVEFLTNNATRWKISGTALQAVEPASLQFLSKVGGGIFAITSDGSMQIGTTGADSLDFETNAAIRWTLDSNGNWVSATSGTLSFLKSNGSLVFGTSSSHTVIFDVNNAAVWQFDTDGSFSAQGGNRKIKNVTDPTADQEAATKNYIDTRFVVAGYVSAVGGSASIASQTGTVTATVTRTSAGQYDVNVAGFTVNGIAIATSTAQLAAVACNETQSAGKFHVTLRALSTGATGTDADFTFVVFKL